jgi:soluble lytic murein transglycosylase
VHPQAGCLDFDSLLEGVIQQESGGRAGVVGPQTRYGQPLGMTQMLPETAREMAGKLGVPFQEELLRGASPEAADYQKKLGAAYLREGLTKHGGDVRKGLMYYHGGPNQKLWGPKTRSYADSILGRLGGR